MSDSKLDSKVTRLRWIVHGTIAVAGLLIVLLNFGPEMLGGSGGSSEQSIPREQLAKIAPAMTDKAYHRNYESEEQCITCHTQQVLNAPEMPHEPRARCAECHKIAA